MSQVIGSGRPGGSQHRILFVGFESALEFWRDDSNLGSYTDCIDPDGNFVFADDFDLSQAASRKSHVSDWSVSLFPERPLDLLVPFGARTDSPLIHLHQMRWNPPHHSFVQGRDGVLIASPELLFLQASASYSLVELLKLGMELCGTYAIDQYEQDGFSSRSKICTVGRIRRYLGWCKHVPGIQKARQAVTMLMDNAHSPLETNAMLALTMPSRYRGVGLKKPQLNERRSTTKLQAETIGDHTYFYDAIWSGATRSGQRYSVDCEVDSNAHHFNNPDDVKADATRRDNIQFMNSTHISITSDELGNADLFMKKALMIAKHIGQRIRRYPRRGTPEQQEAFELGWSKRLNRLDDLLKELSSNGHPPRPRPEELKALKRQRNLQERQSVDEAHNADS